MSPVDLSKVLRPYARQWVALEKETKRVVVHGAKLAEVVAAGRKRCRRPVMMFVPSPDRRYAA